MSTANNRAQMQENSTRPNIVGKRYRGDTG